MTKQYTHCPGCGISFFTPEPAFQFLVEETDLNVSYLVHGYICTDKDILYGDIVSKYKNGHITDVITKNCNFVLSHPDRTIKNFGSVS